MCDFFVYIKKKQYLCRRVSDVYCEFLLANPLRRRDVAQPGSATVWGTGGRKFKSCHPDKYKNNHLIIRWLFYFCSIYIIR